jgi:hypothetical protein
MSASPLVRAWVGTALLAAANAAQADALAPSGVAGSVFFNFPPPARVNLAVSGTSRSAVRAGFLQYAASATPSPFMFGEVTVGPISPGVPAAC